MIQIVLHRRWKLVPRMCDGNLDVLSQTAAAALWTHICDTYRRGTPAVPCPATVYVPWVAAGDLDQASCLAGCSPWAFCGLLPVFSGSVMPYMQPVYLAEDCGLQAAMLGEGDIVCSLCEL